MYLYSALKLNLYAMPQDCATGTHQSFEVICILIIFVFSFGVPIGIAKVIVLNRQQQRAEFSTPAWKYISRKAMTQLGHDNIREVTYAVTDIKLGNRYGSLVSAYNPGTIHQPCT
jgi:hypothetical protein